PFAYYTRYREGGQHALACRKPRDGGEEEILLDGDKEGEGLPFFDLGDADASPDHRLLAWSADRKGSESYTIRVRDIATARDLDDPQAVPRLVAPRRDNVRYDVEHHGDDLLILTNADGAEDFKVVMAPLSAPGPENWRDLVPHRPGVMVLYHLAFSRHYARL